MPSKTKKRSSSASSDSDDKRLKPKGDAQAAARGRRDARQRAVLTQRLLPNFLNFRWRRRRRRDLAVAVGNLRLVSGVRSTQASRGTEAEIRPLCRRRLVDRRRLQALTELGCTIPRRAAAAYFASAARRAGRRAT